MRLTIITVKLEYSIDLTIPYCHVQSKQTKHEQYSSYKENW